MGKIKWKFCFGSVWPKKIFPKSILMNYYCKILNFLYYNRNWSKPIDGFFFWLRLFKLGQKAFISRIQNIVCSSSSLAGVFIIIIIRLLFFDCNNGKKTFCIEKLNWMGWIGSLSLKRFIDSIRKSFFFLPLDFFFFFIYWKLFSWSQSW